MASCSSGACAPEVWRAGYRSTHWRPLVTECDCDNSSLAVPSAPIHSGGEDIPLPQPAVIPLQDELMNTAPPSATVDWEPLLPQTMPLMGGRDNNAEPVTLHREDSVKSDEVLQAHGAAPPPSVPRVLPARPATIQPEPRPTGILPTTLGPPNDPFESQGHPDPPASSASATAVYVPLAWLPTERSELQFKEIP